MSVSASQIKTFEMCPRQWAAKAFAGIKSPVSDSHEVGLRVHKIQEDYCLHGTPPDRTEILRTKDRNGNDVEYRVGEIALAALKNAPPRHVGESERGFTLVTRNAEYVGFIDRRFLRDGVPVIHDFKTTKSWRYVPKPEDLLEDPQAIIYAVHEFAQDPKTVEVVLEWNYAKTKGAATSRFVQQTIDRRTAEIEFSKIERKAAVMERLRANPPANWNDVTPNPGDACNAFAGCPAKQWCKLTHHEQIKQAFGGNEKMSDDLLSQLEASASTPDAPPAPGATQGQINPPEAAQAAASAPPPPPPAAAPAEPQPRSLTAEDKKVIDHWLGQNYTDVSGMAINMPNGPVKVSEVKAYVSSKQKPAAPAAQPAVQPAKRETTPVATGKTQPAPSGKPSTEDAVKALQTLAAFLRG